MVINKMNTKEIRQDIEIIQEGLTLGLMRLGVLRDGFNSGSHNELEVMKNIEMLEANVNNLGLEASDLQRHLTIHYDELREQKNKK